MSENKAGNKDCSKGEDATRREVEMIDKRIEGVIGKRESTEGLALVRPERIFLMTKEEVGSGKENNLN